MEVSIICRFAFLIFIIAASVYFVIINEKGGSSSGGSAKEKFIIEKAPAPTKPLDKDTRDMIVKTYQQYRKRDPSDKEIQTAYGMIRDFDTEFDKREILIRYLNVTSPVTNPTGQTSQNKRVNWMPQPTVESVRSRVMRLYEEILGARPDESQLSPMVTLFADMNYTDDEIRNYLKERKDTLMSSPAIVVPKNVAVADPPLDADREKTMYRMYDIINRTYKNVLLRMPTTSELRQMYDRMIIDSKFTESELAKVLTASDEYRLMEKNQSNQPYGEVPGFVTDAQVNFIVNRIYKEVYGYEVPTQDLEDFLKSKLREYELDEEKFRKLLLMLRDLDTSGSSFSRPRMDGSGSVTDLHALVNDFETRLNPFGKVMHGLE